MLLKDKIAEYGLKPVGEREYEVFITSLMKGPVSKTIDYTQKLQKVKNELKVPDNWKLVDYNFNS